MFFVFNTIIYKTSLIKTNSIFNQKASIPSSFYLVNMEYLCNTNVDIDRNVILNIANICNEKFKEKWNNDLIFSDHSKLRVYYYYQIKSFVLILLLHIFVNMHNFLKKKKYMTIVIQYAKFSYFEWHGLEAMYCITMVMYFFFFRKLCIFTKMCNSRINTKDFI
jgi:hypothetical protein